jgi:hypothetical protein
MLYPDPFLSGRFAGTFFDPRHANYAGYTPPFFDPDEIYPFPSAMSTDFGGWLVHIAAIAWEEIALSPHWNNKEGYTYSYSTLLPNGDFISLNRTDLVYYSKLVARAFEGIEAGEAELDVNKLIEFAPLAPQNAIYLAAMMSGYCDSNWVDWLSEKLIYSMLYEIFALTQDTRKGEDDENEYFVNVENPNLGVFEKSVFLSDLHGIMDGGSWGLIKMYVMELITSFGEYEDMESIEDNLSEICDGLVPVYNYDRKKWFNTDRDAQEFVEEAIREFGDPKKEFDFNDAYGWGMYAQYEQYAYQLKSIFEEHTIPNSDLLENAADCLESFGGVFQPRFLQD